MNHPPPCPVSVTASMCGRVICGLMIVACISPQSALAADPAQAAAATRIPFVVDLKTVSVVTMPQGDFESLKIVDAIDARGYRIVVSGEAPADDGGKPLVIVVPRKVSAADQKSARKRRPYFHTGDGQSFPGTVPGYSTAMINGLRSIGKVSYTYVDVGVAFGMSVVTGEYACELVRVAEPSTLVVLVNGRNTKLPIIHAKGTCTTDGGRVPTEEIVLDDPANPILLRWSGHGKSATVIRIEYPEPEESPSSIENMLARNEVAQVYGIYFLFNRADIRPESKRVLDEIAAALKANPTWKLRVDGHTDGIGNDAANLDLSKRRAAAVKTALVSQYGIDDSRLSTGGYGESSPQATNDTPEGRARNRRVELQRI